MPTQAEIEAAAKIIGRLIAVHPDFARNVAEQALEAAERASWQPIETAPKDRQILVYCEARNLLMEPSIYHVTWGHPNGWITWGNKMIPKKPTHWQPLPSPPESK